MRILNLIFKIKLSDAHWNKLLELALVENKCDFVNLILEHEIDLTKFLTVGRLQALYNNENV